MRLAPRSPFAITVAIGVVGALLWMTRVLVLPREIVDGIGDTNQYLWASEHLQRWQDIFDIDPYRNLAFAGLLRGIAMIAAPFRAWLPELAFRAAMFYGFYAAAVVYFARSLQRAGVALPPWAVIPLLIHPGLAAYSLVRLTEVPTTAALLFGLGALLNFRESPSWRLALGGALALATATLFRPVLVASLPLVGIAFVARQRPGTRLVALTLPLLVLLFLAPTALTCASKQGSLCLTPDDPVTRSLDAGMWSARCYPRADINDVVCREDAFLQRQVASRCDSGLGITELCEDLSPWAVPVFFAKKIVGLFYHALVTCYAAGRATVADALWNRAFSALAFGGFFVLLLLACFDRAWLLPATFVIAHVGAHSLLHVEARYSFPAVPVCLLALSTGTLPRRKAFRVLTLVLLASLLALFFWQAFTWDSAPELLFWDPNR